MESAKIHRLNRERPATSPAATSANSSGSPQKPKLLDQVRQAIRTRHYSYRTENAYVHWIKRYIFFHNKRHPAEMSEKEIAQFLSTLASEWHVSASTQNQALNAILFLYRDVLWKEVGYKLPATIPNRAACRGHAHPAIKRSAESEPPSCRRRGR